MNFFNKIPTITYNNNMARNIMARAKLSDTTKSNSKLFFPYNMTDSDRIDHLSNSYYGSPSYTWLVWFANETIDPYYDLPLSELELNDFIVSKYGSVELAQRKIAYYKINWEDNETPLSVDAYENITDSTKKYWEPVLDYNLNVLKYRRKREDQILNTNRLATFSILMTSGTFKAGEEIQKDGTNYGFCVYSSSSDITLQHVYGFFLTGDILIGKESGATARVFSVNNLASTTSAYSESSYWKPVTYFEHELHENDKKKSILLMDAQYANKAEQELKRVMDVS